MLLLPRVSNLMALSLSWRMMWEALQFCASSKFFVQRTFDRLSSTATSLASVELRVFNFCFLDMAWIAPWPIVMVIPVWGLWSAWTPNEASMLQVTLRDPSALKQGQRIILGVLQEVHHSNQFHPVIAGWFSHSRAKEGDG